MQVANDNREGSIATAGGAFYPEMGGSHDGKALFLARVGYQGYSISWSPERHDEALKVLKSLRVRPRTMDLSETVRGTHKWSASLTWAAGRKVIDGKHAVSELLLD